MSRLSRFALVPCLLGLFISSLACSEQQPPPAPSAKEGPVAPKEELTPPTLADAGKLPDVKSGQQPPDVGQRSDQPTVAPDVVAQQGDVAQPPKQPPEPPVVAVPASEWATMMENEKVDVPTFDLPKPAERPVDAKEAIVATTTADGDPAPQRVRNRGIVDSMERSAASAQEAPRLTGLADLAVPSGADYGQGVGAGGGGLGAANGALADVGIMGLKKEKGSEAKPLPQPTQAWGHSTSSANTARLSVGEREELPLKGAQFKVQIDGFRARVLVDYYFLNTGSRRLEGNFQLRLPNEASTYFFAFGETLLQRGQKEPTPQFDSPRRMREMGLAPRQIMEDRAPQWTAPKEARMVPKEKAAYAYTETVRQRVDPALMEWSGADVFSARVFPLNPNSMARIVVGYDVDLLRLGRDLEYRLDLPSNGIRNVVDISVAAPGGATPQVTPDLAPTTEAGRRVFHWENPLERAILVRMQNASDHTLSGKDAETGDFFATKLRPTLPAAALPPNPNAVFVVDVSLSSNPEAMNIWLSMVQSVLNNNRNEMKNFAVLFFNIETFWWKERFAANTPESVAELTAYMKTLALEGATDLSGALGQAASPSWKPEGTYDLFLLSDGSPTWGDREVLSLARQLQNSKAKAVFSYRTGLSGTDIRVLDALARQTGGAVFSVAGEAEVTAASTAHRYRPWRIVGLTVDGAKDLLLAGRPSALFPDQAVLLVGRGKPAKGAKVVFKLQQGTQILDVPMMLGDVLTSDLAPRAYGQVAVGQLEEFAETTKRESEAYSRHFRVTGQTCSLLMLESEADYERFQIRPEEDAFVVTSLAAGEVVAKVLAQAAAAVADAKSMLLAWAKRLQDMPNLGIKLNSALSLYLERLPASSFNVPSKAIQAKSHGWNGVPGLVKEHLATRELVYDEMTVDAENRLKGLSSADALKTLSSLVENRPGDTTLARDVAFSALAYGFPHSAYHLLFSVVQARPHEPLTYLGLAQVLASIEMYDLAVVWYELALAAQWDSRFGEFRTIVVLDYLRFLRKALKTPKKLAMPEFLNARMVSLGKAFSFQEADLMVLITWNTDNTDVDLHILEPNGEECYYGHNTTSNGGKLTRDVTQGYGPELYVMGKAKKGKYNILAHYYASDSNRESTRTQVSATVVRNWGRPNETEERKVVTLEYGKDRHDIQLLSL